MKAVFPFLLLLCFGVIQNTEAATFQEARVSEVIQDVRLLASKAAARQAVVNDKIGEGTAVRTGAQSRAELTFADLTITRLGENTVFSLNQAAREIHLDHGSVLLEVPPKGAAARVTSAAVTAAVQGGTAIFGTGPPIKFLVLEGVGTFYPNAHPEEMVTLHGGEMVMSTPDGHVTTPQKFDVKTVLGSSALIVDFPALANLPLILQVVDQQQTDQSLTANASPPPSKDIIDVISVNTTANPAVTQTPSPPPPPPLPTPSESGTPSVISSPNPYVITNGTTIKTDTSITTNGRTDFGKIYNGPTQDGPFTLWAFGSTSPFDTAVLKELSSKSFLDDPNSLPIAVLKFQSLLLTGNPTIDTTNGVTHLSLIGVDSITTGPPGGTLTFAGLNLLFLATVNGPIDLTSDVSFQGLSLLAFYARGAGSDLTINSPISGIGDLKMAAENSIQLTNPGTMSVGEFDATAGNNFTLQIGGALSLNGKVRLGTFVLPGTTLASGANFTLNVTGDYTNSSSTDFSRLRVMNEGHIGTGGNISVDITGNLTAAGLGSATAFPEPGDVELLVQNTNAQIDTGGNLNLTVGGNVNVNGLAVYMQNWDFTANPAGHIGTGGNIDVQIAGNLNATSYVDVFLNNRGGGTITSGGNLTFNVSGALTIGVDASTPGFSSEFIISSRYDDSGGNTTPSSIGSNVALFLHAASISMAGDLFGTGISNHGGSTINGNATATWDVTGNLTIQGTADLGGSDASWFILNDTLNPATDPGAHLTNPPGGTINGNATLTLRVGGDVNIAGDTLFQITNQRISTSTAANGGSIFGNAAINISAANFSVGGELDVEIFNQKAGTATGSGGSITGSATINLTVSGNLTATGTDTNSSRTPGDMAFDIFNQGTNGNTVGGSITSDATVNIQTANISATHDFVAQIVNRNGGTIGGKAALTLNATGSVNAGGLAFFGLFNSPGAIGSDASVDVSAASLTAGSFFEAFIENVGGTIGGNATVQVGIPGDLNAGHLFVVIDSSSGGSIGGNETINMNVSGTATVNNEATVQILGPDPTGSAAINFNGGMYQVGGTFFNAIDGNGTITFTNTDLHANVVKVGVFGANGSLIIGGSGTNTISADTLLHLYAPGSNGLLKFVASVTLSSGTAMDLAANTITINSGVTVTIAGNGGAANIFTNNANYAGFGGNGSTTGTFAGNGANNPQPLSNAPVFSAAASSPSSSGTTSVSGNVTSSTKATGSTINVSDSGQLLSLLNSSTAGAGGKITVSNTAGRSRNSRATSPTERSGPGGGAKNVQSRARFQQLPATVAALPRTQ
jgi:hypothetical protein